VRVLGVSFSEFTVDYGKFGKYTVLVDSETYNNNACRASLAGCSDTSAYTFQNPPEKLVPYFSIDEEKKYGPVNINVTGEWILLRNRHLELESQGYRYYLFNIEGDYYYFHPTLEKVLETYQYNGEAYYVMQQSQFYKYVLMGDVNNDRIVNIADILAMRDHIMGLEELYSYLIPYGDFNSDGSIEIIDIMGARDVIFGEE